MKAAKATAVVLLLSVMGLTAMVMSSEQADADSYYVQEEDISVSMSLSSTTMQLNSSKTFWIDFKDNSTKDVVVYVSINVIPTGVSVSYPQGNRVILEAGQISGIEVTVTLGTLVEFSSKDIDFEIKIVDPDRGLPIYSNTPHVLTIKVSETADTSGVDKFLGIYDNNLPSFMGESWFAALVTFVFIIAIGYLVSFRIVPAVRNRMGARK